MTHHSFSVTCKATVLKVLNNEKSVKQLGMADVDMVDIIYQKHNHSCLCVTM